MFLPDGLLLPAVVAVPALVEVEEGAAKGSPSSDPRPESVLQEIRWGWEWGNASKAGEISEPNNKKLPLLDPVPIKSKYQPFVFYYSLEPRH